ncbi:MAG: cation transporter [Planctomycetes bacterium]|nr:cation transporter [Planctomycetota bacterium]
MSATRAAPGHPPTDPTARRAALLGVVVNIALAGVKLLAGLLGHSQALIADAVESLVDIMGGIIIWGGLRVGAVPADENHPYGHARAESFAALAVSGAIVLAGVGVGIKAVESFGAPARVPEAWTLLVLAAVVGTKEALFRYVRSVARKHRSGALLVDAWHHRSDAVTSVAAFIGIALALLAGPAFARADTWAALFAAAIIVWNGVSLGTGPFNDLMDRSPSGTAAASREAALAVPGVRGIEKVYTRRSGSLLFVDMHVEVDPAMSVRDAHVVSGKVKAKVRDAVPGVANVLVHIEPDPRDNAPASVGGGTLS